jgi:hypothetical protein
VVQRLHHGLDEPNFYEVLGLKSDSGRAVSPNWSSSLLSAIPTNIHPKSAPLLHSRELRLTFWNATYYTGSLPLRPSWTGPVLPASQCS